MALYWDDGTSLYHYGIPGQKWGIRRWQNADGSFTTEGKIRYGRIKTTNVSNGTIKDYMPSTAFKNKQASTKTIKSFNSAYDDYKNFGKNRGLSYIQIIKRLQDPNDSYEQEEDQAFVNVLKSKAVKDFMTNDTVKAIYNARNRGLDKCYRNVESNVNAEQLWLKTSDRFDRDIKTMIDAYSSDKEFRQKLYNVVQKNDWDPRANQGKPSNFRWYYHDYAWRWWS